MFPVLSIPANSLTPMKIKKRSKSIKLHNKIESEKAF